MHREETALADYQEAQGFALRESDRTFDRTLDRGPGRALTDVAARRA